MQFVRVRLYIKARYNHPNGCRGIKLLGLSPRDTSNEYIPQVPFQTKPYTTLLSDTSEIYEYLNSINDGDNESDGYHLLSLRMYQFLDQTTKFL